MKPIVILLSVIFLLMARPATAQNGDPIRVCVDNNFWAPYTFTMHGAPVGIHVEISKRAFHSLSLPYTMIAVTWNRCIEGSKTGYYDAVLSGSYAEYRTAHFHFPEDAHKKVQSKWRVTQAEYVVVVQAEDFKPWDGDALSLPQPIGIPLGYAAAQQFKEMGIPVISSHKYKDLFNMLLLGRTKALLVMKQTAELYMSEEDNWKYLRILERPYVSRSYFLLFPKNSRIPYEQVQRIWDAIAKVRDDKAAWQEIAPSVDRLVAKCFENPSSCNY